MVWGVLEILKICIGILYLLGLKIFLFIKIFFFDKDG